MHRNLENFKAISFLPFTPSRVKYVLGEKHAGELYSTFAVKTTKMFFSGLVLKQTYKFILQNTAQQKEKENNFTCNILD